MRRPLPSRYFLVHRSLLPIHLRLYTPSIHTERVAKQSSEKNNLKGKTREELGTFKVLGKIT
jgi:hypothetical protein